MRKNEYRLDCPSYAEQKKPEVDKMTMNQRQKLDMSQSSVQSQIPISTQ